MGYEAILLERRGHTAHVTLNRPENLNAYNYEMHRDMNLAWDEINADDDIYSIVVTGAGRAFCSGADMKERSRGQAKGGLGREQTPEPAGEQIGNFKHNNMSGMGLPRAHDGYPGKPLIAAIHGICCGDGVGWLYRSDFVICSEDATFFDPHVNVGAHPTSISNMQTCCIFTSSHMSHALSSVQSHVPHAPRPSIKFSSRAQCVLKPTCNQVTCGVY